jgi:hypothetical protein
VVARTGRARMAELITQAACHRRGHVPAGQDDGAQSGEGAGCLVVQPTRRHPTTPAPTRTPFAEATRGLLHACTMAGAPAAASYSCIPHPPDTLPVRRGWVLGGSVADKRVSPLLLVESERSRRPRCSWRGAGWPATAISNLSPPRSVGSSERIRDRVVSVPILPPVADRRCGGLRSLHTSIPNFAPSRRPIDTPPGSGGPVPPWSPSRSAALCTMGRPPRPRCDA